MWVEIGETINAKETTEEEVAGLPSSCALKIPLNNSSTSDQFQTPRVNGVKQLLQKRQRWDFFLDNIFILQSVTDSPLTYQI